jgi:glycosyltransferase involved in cell wall biosynthesis
VSWGPDDTGAGIIAVVNRTRRILHVSVVHRADDPRIFERECRSLADHGYDVAYLCPGAPDEERRDGVRLLALSQRARRQRIRYGLDVVRAVRRVAPAVVHLHDPELLTLVPLLTRLGPRVVYDMHEHLAQAVLGKYYIPARLRPLASRAAGVGQRLLAAHADGVAAVVPSQFDTLGARPATRVVLPNYPRFARFAAPHAVAELAADPRLKLIHVGTLSQDRGLSVMLEAMRVAGDGCVLYLGGVFPNARYEAEVREALAGELGARVRLLGRVPPARLPDYLAAADVVWVAGLATAQYKLPAHSTKLYEGMAVGLAVLTSDLPGRGDVVRAARCGLAVPPTVAGQAAGLLELLDRRERLRELGERGKAAVRERWSWEAIEADLLGFYERLGAGGRDERNGRDGVRDEVTGA